MLLQSLEVLHPPLFENTMFTLNQYLICVGQICEQLWKQFWFTSGKPGDKQTGAYNMKELEKGIGKRKAKNKKKWKQSVK